MITRLRSLAGRDYTTITGRPLVALGAGGTNCQYVSCGTGATCEYHRVYPDRQLTYVVEAIDALCGTSPPSASIIVTNGPATLGPTAYINIVGNQVANQEQLAVFRNTIFVGMARPSWPMRTQWSFNDSNNGYILATHPCIADSVTGHPAAGGSPENLITTISSGAGTTSVTLTDAATTAVTGGVVVSEDTAAVNAALKRRQYNRLRWCGRSALWSYLQRNEPVDSFSGDSDHVALERTTRLVVFGKNSVPSYD